MQSTVRTDRFDLNSKTRSFKGDSLSLSLSFSLSCPTKDGLHWVLGFFLASALAAVSLFLTRCHFSMRRTRLLNTAATGQKWPVPVLVVTLSASDSIHVLFSFFFLFFFLPGTRRRPASFAGVLTLPHIHPSPFMNWRLRRRERHSLASMVDDLPARSPC